MSRQASALMGALVADAAGLGLHWIYDVDRIAEITKDRSPAFTPIDAKNYDGVPAYFAHAARRDGQLSQYGETLALAMRSIHDNDGFDVAAYQTAYTNHFGPGGSYIGYIDRPTRGTLANIANEQTDPSGVDDDQHPAIATLPAIVAKYGRDKTQITSAMEVTNVNEAARHYGRLFASTLTTVTSGFSLTDALEAAAKSEPLLQSALNSQEDSIAYGETTGRACHLHQGMPLSWHILANTKNYTEAVETNIKAGGDSAGRALIIGALSGASYGLIDIPQIWLENTENARALMDLAETF
jgi:hypothetical protein